MTPIIRLFSFFALLAAASPAPAGDPKAETDVNPFNITSATDLHLTVEFVEIALADWSDWLAGNQLTADASKLRTAVDRWKKDEKASIFETVTVRARNGQRAKAESVNEITYPTQFDPATVPGTLSNVHNLVASPSTAIHPATFETRKVGVTVEVDPIISPDRKSVELNLSPEIVRQGSNLAWPNADVAAAFRAETPQFFTAKITTQMTVKPGVPSLVGTVRLPRVVKNNRTDPIVLVFVRADVD